ncbi:MAG: type II secretion system major pseudopilin GspG [bacterium]
MSAINLSQTVRYTSQRGFTLIEILIVVVILGVLAGVVAPKLFGEAERARIVRAKQDIDAMKTALNLYRLDNFNYPGTDQGLEALVNPPGGSPPAPNWRQGGYLEKLPIDPWGNPYQYLSPGQHGDFDIYSLGKDGRLGGDGDAADIGSW